MSVFDKVDMTDYKLVVKDNHMEFDDAQALYAQLDRNDRCANWWIGDLLNWMEGAYGEEWAQVLDPEELHYEKRIQAKRVSKQFPVSTRVRKLSWSHHREALSSENPKEALAWAKEHEASVRELKDHIKAEKPPKGLEEKDWEPPTYVYVQPNHRWSNEPPEDGRYEVYTVGDHGEAERVA